VTTPQPLPTAHQDIDRWLAHAHAASNIGRELEVGPESSLTINLNLHDEQSVQDFVTYVANELSALRQAVRVLADLVDVLTAPARQAASLQVGLGQDKGAGASSP
jgi:hypothetical protein